MFKNPIVKTTLSLATVIGGGFVLLNATFLFAFVFQTALLWVIDFFTSAPDATNSMIWAPYLYPLFVLTVAIISWFIFKSKLSVLFKATYLTVPIAVLLVTVGMFLYRWPIAVYTISFIFDLCLLYYFYSKQKPWLYAFSVILVSVVLGIMDILNVEI